MKKALIISAEHSSEKYAVAIVNEFKKKSDVQFFGVGGDRLKESGVEILLHNNEFSIVGIVEVFSKLYQMKKYMNLIVKFAVNEKIKFVILIDFPDFNLRLAKKLKKHNIKVFYYIGPTVWAWRYKRVNIIRKYIDRIFLIFPFETKIYQKEKITHTFTGHPLGSKVISNKAGEIKLKTKYNIAGKKKVITLLPGSRKSEIDKLLAPLVSAAQHINQEVESEIFLLKADSINAGWIKEIINQINLKITIVNQIDAYELISISDAVISSCGTSNLEICFLSTPFCAVYKVNSLSYLLGKGFLKINLFSIVNILAGREIIKEFIQENLKPEKIAKEILRILKNPEYCSKMVENFNEINNSLKQETDPFEVIVDTILDDISEGQI